MTIKAWHPRLDYYEKLVAIELNNTKSWEKLAKVFHYNKNLRTCPQDDVAFGSSLFIVPKEAVSFLPKDIKMKIVELRDTNYIDDKINNELAKRLKNNSKKQSYYAFKERGMSPVYLMPYVRLSTVKRIAKELNLKVDKNKE